MAISLSKFVYNWQLAELDNPLKVPALCHYKDPYQPTTCYSCPITPGNSQGTHDLEPLLPYESKPLRQVANGEE